MVLVELRARQSTSPAKRCCRTCCRPYLVELAPRHRRRSSPRTSRGPGLAGRRGRAGVGLAAVRPGTSSRHVAVTPGPSYMAMSKRNQLVSRRAGRRPPRGSPSRACCMCSACWGARAGARSGSALLTDSIRAAKSSSRSEVPAPSSRIWLSGLGVSVAGTRAGWH